MSACILLTLPGQTQAAEAGARAYGNAPVGLNVLQLLYFQSESRNNALRLSSHAGVLRYYRYFELFGQGALIGGFLPYASAKLSIPAAGIHQRTIGMADPTLVFGMDFFGAPALTHGEISTALVALGAINKVVRSPAMSRVLEKNEN